MERTITLAGKSFALRFDLMARRDVEKKLGKGLLAAMQDGELESIATIAWATLRLKGKRLESPEDVLDLFQEHQNAGGTINGVLAMVYRTIFDAKSFGRAISPKLVNRLLKMMGEDEDIEDEEGKAPAAPEPA